MNEEIYTYRLLGSNYVFIYYNTENHLLIEI